MKIKVEVGDLVAHLSNAEKRLAFSVADSINDVARSIQAAEVENAKSRMNVRNRRFIAQEIAKITKFASVGKNRLEAVIEIGQKKRLILSGLETGAQRFPVKGRTVAVPITGEWARLTEGVALTQYTFRNLRLVKVKAGQSLSGKVGKIRRNSRGGSRRVSAKFTAHKTSGGLIQWKGQFRTFMLQHSRKLPDGGVLQRTGPKKDDLVLVYKFKRPFKLPTKLEWMRVATRVYQSQFAATVQARLARELRRK